MPRARALRVEVLREGVRQTPGDEGMPGERATAILAGQGRRDSRRSGPSESTRSAFRVRPRPDERGAARRSRSTPSRAPSVSHSSPRYARPAPAPAVGVGARRRPHAGDEQDRPIRPPAVDLRRERPAASSSRPRRHADMGDARESDLAGEHPRRDDQHGPRRGVSRRESRRGRPGRRRRAASPARREDIVLDADRSASPRRRSSPAARRGGPAWSTCPRRWRRRGRMPRG